MIVPRSRYVVGFKGAHTIWGKDGKHPNGAPKTMYADTMTLRDALRAAHRFPPSGSVMTVYKLVPVEPAKQR